MAATNTKQQQQQQQLQLVPEAILKKKHDMDEMKAKRAASAITNPRGNKKIFSKSSSKKYKINKPETYIANARTRKNQELRYKRVLKKGMQKRASNKKIIKTKIIVDDDDDDDVDNIKKRNNNKKNKQQKQSKSKEIIQKYQSNSVDANMVFVIRIRDQVGCPNVIKRALSRLRLRNVNEGVFIRYNESNRKMLHLVEPYVIYGIPSKGIVEDLIKRRGYGKCSDDKKRIPISDNTVIEEALGESTGIICVEDLVHELCNPSTNNKDKESNKVFHKASTFLWPFRLSALKSKFQKDKLNDKDGDGKSSRDEYGDKGELIDDYIKQML